MKGYLLVFLGACSYGILAPLVVLAYQAGYTLNDVMGCQMVLGAILLWSIVFFRRRTIKTGSLSKKKVAQLLLTGTTTGVTGLLYYASLKYLSPALGVVLFLQFTWMGIALDAIANKRWPKNMQVIALLIIILGTVFATNVMYADEGLIKWQGVLLALLAALSNAIRIFASGKLATNIDPIFRSAIMITGGAIVTSLIVPPTFLLHFSTLKALLFSYGLPLAFFGSFFGVWMFAKGVPLISVGASSILSAMQLPVTIILSVFVLQHAITASQFMGVIIILLGVSIAESKFTKRQKSTT